MRGEAGQLMLMLHKVRFIADVAEKRRVLSAAFKQFKAEQAVVLAEQAAALKVQFEQAFADADLPEVRTDQLEAGTYTNAQLVEMMAKYPKVLLSYLRDIGPGAGRASTRSILSFAVEMFLSDVAKAGGKSK